jgi:hypothetical protein
MTSIRRKGAPNFGSADEFKEAFAIDMVCPIHWLKSINIQELCGQQWQLDEKAAQAMFHGLCSPVLHVTVTARCAETTLQIPTMLALLQHSWPRKKKL